MYLHTSVMGSVFVTLLLFQANNKKKTTFGPMSFVEYTQIFFKNYLALYIYSHTKWRLTQNNHAACVTVQNLPNELNVRKRLHI